VNALLWNERLPVGVSLAARPNGEAELLALGEVVEHAAGRRDIRPRISLQG
jgi:Asp-tRNA(Asn)/Glu-tRNA(Gln) amidotransferase A subunit family amidase